MDRMQHRSGMRLHGDPVIRPKRMKIERGHDRRHRGATRLVTANLEAIGALADVIGVVDGPGAEPAQPVVEQFQRGNVGRGLLQHATATSRSTAVSSARMFTMFTLVSQSNIPKVAP